MKKPLLLWAGTTAVLVAASFLAGSSFRARRQGEVEEARASFFELAQGQFHWPERSKEWTEMLVPLGSFDFSEYGDRWRFTAMYEGTQPSCEVEVILRDGSGKKGSGASQTLSRATPEQIPVNLASLRKEGLDLKGITEIVLRIRGNGKAGRLLVSGLVNPRPALVKQVDGR